jgi:hypothetical protein
MYLEGPLYMLIMPLQKQETLHTHKNHMAKFNHMAWQSYHKP